MSMIIDDRNNSSANDDVSIIPLAMCIRSEDFRLCLVNDCDIDSTKMIQMLLL